MTPHGLSLPFSIDDLYSGLARVDGLLRLKDDQLLIEFQKQDNLMGIFKGNSQSRTIPLRQIFKVELKSSWFGRSLLLRPTTLSAFQGIPGADEGELKLKFKKRDLELAKDLVSHLNLRLSEIRLQDMDEE